MYTGRPSVFLRFFGCNFRCPGFKCDTPYAIYPDQKDKAFAYEPEYIAEMLYNCLPDTQWQDSNTFNDVHLVITGGEPLLKGTQKNIVKILDRLEELQYLTIETNGTQKISDDFYNAMMLWGGKDLTASISTKLLSVSGEDSGWNMETLHRYIDVFDNIQFKVVMNNTDAAWLELDLFRKALYNAGWLLRPDVSLWVMPIGNDAESQEGGEAAVIADRALALGYNVSCRVHAVLYNDAKDK